MSNPPNYRQRQEDQLAKFREWTEHEGGVELPTQLATMLEPAQLLRCSWLRSNAIGSVLEVGCNFGFILAYVGGAAGIDISEPCIMLARIMNPKAVFEVGDATKLNVPDKGFDTVMLPEILEHLDFEKEVPRAIAEACRVARRLVLVTFPDGAYDNERACSFKHAWLADSPHVMAIEGMFKRQGGQTEDTHLAVPGFVTMKHVVGSK